MSILFFNLLNKLAYFLKLKKNNITFILFNTFLFKAKYTMSKSII